MLMADPAVLRRLVERYDELAGQARTDTPSPDLRRRLDDVSYTLCVSTGTREIGAALAAARSRTESDTTE